MRKKRGEGEPPVATRAGRRRLVVTLYAGLAVTGALMAGPEVPRGTPWWPPFALALLLSMVVTIGAAVALYRAGRRLGDDQDERLDERQVAIRNDAYLRAYRVVATLLIVLVQYMVIAPGFGLPLPERVTWAVMSWTVMLFTITLPSAILAWREPDLDGEDGEPGDVADAPVSGVGGAPSRETDAAAGLVGRGPGRPGDLRITTTF